MIENSGFAAFAMFHALKLHFTSDSYDYVKYNGKTNVTKTTFSTRKDKYSFYRLSRKFGLTELRDYYIANFMVEDIQWVGDILGPESEDNYKKWQKRIQSLTYTFENDIIKLLDRVDNPNDLLIVRNNEFPLLMQYVQQKDIALETLIILNDLMNFFPMWEKEIYDDLVWPNFKRKCEKYKPFLSYDKVKFKQILKEKIKEYA
jgi:T4 gene Gp59 loader of gp41 DNA helicase/T4 gene Gp59 loader of gp41 DNA helicase C-term